MDVLRDMVLFWIVLAASVGMLAGWFLRRMGESAWKQALYSHSQESVNEANRERDRTRAESAKLQAAAGSRRGRSGKVPPLTRSRLLPAAPEFVSRSKEREDDDRKEEVR